jgi:hypothetical protein
MFKVNKEEFAQYVIDQPDDRPVNFGESYYEDDCGCLMVHFGKDKGWVFNDAGKVSWRGESGKPFAELVDCNFRSFFPDNRRKDSLFYSELKPKAKKILDQTQ